MSVTELVQEMVEGQKPRTFAERMQLQRVVLKRAAELMFDGDVMAAVEQVAPVFGQLVPAQF